MNIHQPFMFNSYQESMPPQQQLPPNYYPYPVQLSRQQHQLGGLPTTMPLSASIPAPVHNSVPLPTTPLPTSIQPQSHQYSFAEPPIPWQHSQPNHIYSQLPPPIPQNMPQNMHQNMPQSMSQNLSQNVPSSLPPNLPPQNHQVSDQYYLNSSAVLPVSAVSSAFVPSSMPSRSSISSVSSNSTNSSLQSPISPVSNSIYFSSPNINLPPAQQQNMPLSVIPDIATSTSLFQMFEHTPLHEPHMLYCKKCALFKPAVEFASTTGFFNNNCKHCRNYRRKGEDAKSEAVQELYRVSSYDQLKSTLYQVISARRAKGSPLICVHFYLEASFIGSLGDGSEHDRIDSPRYQTVEGRSILANSIVREIKQVDMYSYNHRSTRIFKSGETHKYLCSQSTALPWRQKKRNAALAAAKQAGMSKDYNNPCATNALDDDDNATLTPDQYQEQDPDLHNCSGTVLVKFKSPGQPNQRVCVAYCHDVSHSPKLPKKGLK